MGAPNTQLKSRAISVSLLTACFALATVACEPKPTSLSPLSPADSAALIGRFLARPGARTGTVPIGLSVQAIAEGSRPFGLYVPTTYDTSRVWPVTFLLHGYGVSGEEMAVDFQTYAESAGVVVIAPNSYSNTWDLFQFGFGTDVAHINNVLTWAFAHIAVDVTRLSISGFSDGGTYSLWLGLKNGDLFTRIAAMSPCSVTVPSIRTGNPAVFISHGTDDLVAPIDQCSRITVPKLQADGYAVEFVEYPSATSPPSNGHYVPPDVLTHAMTFLSLPPA